MSGNAPLPRARLPGFLLLLLALFLATAPQFLSFPEPQAERVLAMAEFSLGGGEGEAVSLPHRWPRGVPFGPASSRYVVEFDVAEVPADPSFLLVPVARQHLAAELNGRPLVQISSEPWLDPAAGAARRFRIPDGALAAGGNRLVLTLAREHAAIPGYLSRLYLGGERMISFDHWSRVFGTERVRAAGHGLHLVIVIALATLWTARRNDPAFGWLALIGVASFVVAVPSESNLPSALAFIKPYIVLLLPAFGLMSIALGLAMTGTPVPRWLRLAVPGVPALLVSMAAAGVAPPFALTMTGGVLAIGTHLAASAVAARAFLLRRRWEYGLLAIPFFLTGWYGLRDIAVVAGIVDGAFLLSGFVRPLTMLAILMLLMRRLAFSLDELDGANETLRLRLAEREAELSILHEKERRRTAQAVREHERQRLMHDLHDGLSGHLVSIIALSERKKADQAAIERAAREALNDLRLVINSLDIGDRDLPLALASFRERLERQLRRLGVELAWSVEELPEVAGLTPANALSILRILQEAVTNALKHGPATRIAIRGSPGAAGTAVLTVENDGVAAPEAGRGHGLANMRRRAEQLGGSVSLAPIEIGMRLTLTLPAMLAEPAAEPAAGK